VLATGILELAYVKSVQFTPQKVRLEREEWGNWEEILPHVELVLEAYFDEYPDGCPGLAPARC
jgi:hypothetical protein